MSCQAPLQLVSDGHGTPAPVLLGHLHIHVTGAREIFSVSWDDAVLEHNAPDLEQVAEVAPHFRIRPGAVAGEIIRIQQVVRGWPQLARRLRIPAREQERTAPAFRLSS